MENDRWISFRNAFSSAKGGIDCLAFYDRLLNPATRLPSLYHSAIFREGMFVEIETWSVFYFVPVNSYSIARCNVDSTN